MTGADPLDAWLRRLGWALGRLDPRERDEIVRETRSHIEERVAAGRSLEAALAEFGPAERHARQFVDEMEAYEALGSQRTGDLARFVTGRAHRNLFAAGTLLLLLALGVAAAVVVLLVALKILDPVHTGIWTGPGMVLIGVIDDPSSARDVLGAWLFPLAALILTLAWVAGRLLLSFAVSLLTPRRV